MEKWIRSKYQPNLPLGENGKKVTESTEHIQLSKNAAKEGMVLLKNDRELIRQFENIEPCERSVSECLFDL